MRIAPGDIQLSTEGLKSVAMLNVLEGTISNIEPLHGGRIRIDVDVDVDVDVAVAGHKLNIAVNQKCFTEMSYQAGQNVYVNFNKVYIERLF